MKSKSAEKAIRKYVYTKVLSLLDLYFKADNNQSVAEWVTENVYFNEPGNSSNFNLIGREYIKEPLELFGDLKTHDITLVFGSQSGKTAMIMAGICYIVTHTPTRILWVMPGQDLADSFSTTRWVPMLRASTTNSLLPKDKRKTKKAQQIIGASIVSFVGSNSPANLASTPARVVVMDEVDKFNCGTSKEADAVNLAEQRTKTFVYPKKIKTSTPTVEDGLVWQSYKKADQCRYYVPCPKCGKEVVFAWAKSYSVLPTLGNEAYIYWSKDAKKGGKWDYDEVAKTAHALCPFCQYKINDLDKTKMIRNGHWRSTNSLCEKGKRSFHLSSIYSTDPENSFGKLAVKFLENQVSLGGLQSFINGDLAEPWENQESICRTELLLSNTLDWSKEKTYKILTADYQLLSPHIWYVVREWKENGDSRISDFGHLETFDELDLKQKQHGILDTAVGIDSGFDATNVYQTCAEHGRFNQFPGCPPRHLGWIPMKGYSTMKYWYDPKTNQRMVYGFNPANLTHKRYSMDVLGFNGDCIKDILQRMRLQKTTEKWALTEIVNDEYYKHLSAESKIERIQQGRKVWVWELRNKERPNHLLDCEVMQLVMAMLFKLLSMQLTKDVHFEK